MSSLAHHFEEAGFLAWPIVVCFVVSVVLVAERTVALGLARRGGWATETVVQRLRATRDVEHVLGVCASMRGALARVLAAGLRAADRRGPEIHAEMEHARALEVARARRRLGFVLLSGEAATLLGFAGAVLGLSFEYGCSVPSDTTSRAIILAKSLSEALNNTAMGLFAGSLSLIAYLLLSRAARSLDEHLAAESARVHIEVLSLHRHLRFVSRPAPHTLATYR